MNKIEELDIPDNLKTLLLSKEWKERKEGYNKLSNMWKESPNSYLGLISFLCKESAAPALESAVDCLLVLKRPIPSLLQHISNIKIKDKIKEHVKNYYNTFLTEILNILSSKNPKNILAMLETLIEVEENEKSMDEEIKSKLIYLLQHQDKKIRSKTIEFIVEIHKNEGNSIFNYLDGIKPIVRKEIEDEIKKKDEFKVETEELKNNKEETKIFEIKEEFKVPVIKKEINNFIPEIQNKKETFKINNSFKIDLKVNERTETKKELPDDLFPDLQILSSSVWKERVQILEKIKELSLRYKIPEEVLIEVGKKLGDINIQVVGLSIDILKLHVENISNNLKRSISGLLVSRLKEKKLSLVENIIEFMLSLNFDPEIISVYLSDKNPEVRKNLIIYFKKIKSNTVVEKILDCVNDQIGSVRELSMEYLAEKISQDGNNKIFLDKIDEIKVKRIMKIKEGLSPRDCKNESLIVNNKTTEIKNTSRPSPSIRNQNARGEMKNSTVKSTPNSSFRGQTPMRSQKKFVTSKIEIKQKLDGNLEEFKHCNFRTDDCMRIKDIFYNKYPFLGEKEWTKRLEGLNLYIEEIKKNNIIDIITFIYAHNDGVFQVTQKLYDLINVEKIENNDIFPLLKTLELKFSDLKLRNKIIIFLLELANKNKNLVVNFILNYIKQKKRGKGFSDGIKILKEIIKNTKIEEEIIFDKYTGIEKEQIKEIEAIIKDKQISKPEIQEEIKIPVEKEIPATPTVDNKNNIFNIEEERRIKRQNISKDIFLENTAEREKSGNENLVFKESFLERIKNGEDIRSLFESIDKIHVSDIILKYFYADKLTDIYYFQGLIENFIKENYILSDYELKMIIKIIIQNEWYHILEGIEKIYPLSKLYNIYQSVIISYNGEDIPSNHRIINNILEQITKLIKRTDSFRGNINFYVKLKENKNLDNRLLNEILKNKVENILVRNNYNSFMSPLKKKPAMNRSLEEIEEDLSRISIHEDHYNPFASDKSKDTDHLDSKEEYNNNNNININNNNNNIKSNLNNNINNNIKSNNNNNIKNNNNNINNNDSIFLEEFNSNTSKNNINLEEILNNLIDKDINISIDNFNKLYNIMVKDIKILYFISNSIINSIIIQLKDKNSTEYSSSIIELNSLNSYIYKILYMLSQDPLFLLELSSDTLQRLHKEMIRIENIEILEVLMNNITPESTLSIYLSCININEHIIIQLIERHRELVIENRNRVVINNIFYVLRKFLDKNYLTLIKRENVFIVIKKYIKSIIDNINDREDLSEILKDYNIDGYLKILIENIYSREIDFPKIKSTIKNKIDEVNNKF